MKFEDSTGSCIERSADCSISRNACAKQKKSRSFLQEKQAVEIFQMKIENTSRNVRDRVSASAIGRVYGVSEKTVRDIWGARTWRFETQHLDTTRQLVQVAKNLGRPLGSKDKSPRRVSSKVRQHAKSRQVQEARDIRGQAAMIASNPTDSVKTSNIIPNSFLFGAVSKVPKKYGIQHRNATSTLEIGSCDTDVRPCSSKFFNSPSLQPIEKKNSINDLLFMWDEVPPSTFEDPFQPDWLLQA